jgi:hypothetical protein
MQTCGLKSLVEYFDVNTHGIWKMYNKEGDFTEHVCPLGFQDIREGVTLQSLRCIALTTKYTYIIFKCPTHIKSNYT